MEDLFDKFSPSLESPAEHLLEVIPSDTQDIPFASRALNVAESGTIRVTTLSGQIATVAVSAGVPFPLRCKRIWATGTTATGIVSMY